MAAKRIGGRIYSENIRKVAPNGITPFVKAIPLRIEPIACSRIPKWKLRPSRCSCVNEVYSFRVVSVVGERSAQPPIKFGKLPAMAFNTLPEAGRVAILGSVGLNTSHFASHPLVNFPLTYN